MENNHYEMSMSKEDSNLISLITPYKQKMQKQMEEVIGASEVAMTKEQPEGILGNFVADCLYTMSKNYLGKDSAKIDAVLLNNGGLRTSLPKGEIKVSNIFELMPFDNELKIVKLSGEQCEKMFAFIAEKGGMPIANLRMKIENNQAKDVFIGNQIFDRKKSYYILSSDYLIAGGDKMNFFANAESSFSLNVLIRDAIIDYFKLMKKEDKKINPKLDGRISISK